MTETTRPARRGRPFELTAALLASVMAGVVVWTMAPILPQFPGATLPWPAHGVTLAVLLATDRRFRVHAAVALILANWIGGALGGGDPGRSLAAALLLLAQSVIVTLLYERLARGSTPLDGIGSYVRSIAAIVIGSVPAAWLAIQTIQLTGSSLAPGFTLRLWWIAAVTSNICLVPIGLGAIWRAPAYHRERSLLSVEFAVGSALFVLTAVSCFFVVGPWGASIPTVAATVPFLVWAGIRFGINGLAALATGLVLIVLASTIADRGPFRLLTTDVAARDRRVWIYLASLVSPSMLFPVTLWERARAERRARDAIAQLTAIVDTTSDLVASVDRDLVILAANDPWLAEYEQLAGVRARPGMHLADVLAPFPLERDHSIARWKRALAGERFTDIRAFGDPARKRAEYEITYGPVKDPATGEIVGATQVVRNISERLRADAEKAETRRLESIGRLAGGVAHDFNNLMTAVMGYADLISRSLPAEDPRRGDLGEIERAAGRAGELTQQLLAFARRRVIEPRLVDPGALLDDFTRLLAPLLGQNVALIVRHHPGLHRVRVDPTQFEQVIMNLAVNARDAMPGGGRLVIEAANTVRDGAEGISLIVRDTGTGMPPEVLARVWEPFFTTKPLGQGTGLGLPTVHGIVHQAGGQIEVESTPGVGTTFHLFFPAAAPAITAMLDGPLPPAQHTP